MLVYQHSAVTCATNVSTHRVSSGAGLYRRWSVALKNPVDDPMPTSGEGSLLYAMRHPLYIARHGADNGCGPTRTVATGLPVMLITDAAPSVGGNARHPVARTITINSDYATRDTSCADRGSQWRHTTSTVVRDRGGMLPA